MAPVTQGEPWLAQVLQPSGASVYWWKKYPAAKPTPPNSTAIPALNILPPRRYCDYYAQRRAQDTREPRAAARRSSGAHAARQVRPTDAERAAYRGAEYYSNDRHKVRRLYTPERRRPPWRLLPRR